MRLEIFGREAIGQRGEISRRLVEPHPAEQFAELLRLFHPRRLPRHLGDEVGFLPQPRREFAGQFFGGLGIRRAERDDEFARVGEMLLVKFQALHRRLVRRQQVEHVHVEAQPHEAERDSHEEQSPPPAFQKGTHGDKNPSTVSPVLEFSSRQPPSGFCSNLKYFGNGFPSSAAGK